ncbi:hypothetical protein MTR67_016769 [Solanum verrucosum]|uniref:Uncharacterized protein n=1 Tax=Solanum verrucosum TaxID=315347 RepID=A0AAF0QGM3_SOLVR|nr:hypothetical protein MTR67_016769 [Solanum verrucosum]
MGYTEPVHGTERYHDLVPVYRFRFIPVHSGSVPVWSGPVIHSVEAWSLPRFSYDELFNSQDKVDVAGGLNYLDRSKGGGKVPTPSPPNPNLRTHWWIPIEPPLKSPPPPPTSSKSYPP